MQDMKTLEITDEEAYNGNYSLKFDIPVGYDVMDLLVLENMHTKPDVSCLEIYLRISVWIKGMNLEPDSVVAVGDAWSVAITPIFHNTIGNNEGWGQYAGKSIFHWIS